MNNILHGENLPSVSSLESNVPSEHVNEFLNTVWLDGRLVEFQESKGPVLIEIKQSGTTSLGRNSGLQSKFVSGDHASLAVIKNGEVEVTRDPSTQQPVGVYPLSRGAVDYITRPHTLTHGDLVRLSDTVYMLFVGVNKNSGEIVHRLIAVPTESSDDARLDLEAKNLRNRMSLLSPIEFQQLTQAVHDSAKRIEQIKLNRSTTTSIA